MGNYSLQEFAKQPDVRIAALCDVDSGHLADTRKALEALRPGAPVELYADFRQLLERRDLDAIVCATPDHWHTLVALNAFEAGKDVYGEKPISHTYAEARALTQACRRQGRIFQLGTQIHGQENYHRVVEIVRSGVLGDIHEVNLWLHGGAPHIEAIPDSAPPETLNWDMWLGPAPQRSYNANRCHRLFRHFWDYSGGSYSDFWCHIADLMYWALDLREAPLRVRAVGGKALTGMAETAAWIDVDYEFPHLHVTWSSTTPEFPGAAKRSIGARFIGSQGTLVADYTSRLIFIDGKELDDIPEIPRTLPRSPGHQRNFLDCVKSRSPADSNLDYAFPMTTPMYLGCIAYRLGRPLQWDAATEQFVGDPEATAMLSQPYRAPWVLPGF
jgi:predicted dehydrogenase